MDQIWENYVNYNPTIKGSHLSSKESMKPIIVMEKQISKAVIDADYQAQSCSEHLLTFGTL